ncbi:hypothetical protein M3P21_03610 [Ruegeria sp. 2012CJ41-6]|uniref:4Fe-4S ferredoxin-type domain-containing protein n=1 Tax=Ruegeria spongiae TaxID=2942209 RepID=A0ABT0PYI5_9RHOB|nr:DUF2946 family protein [Ruegeria spongiae]MCL6282607.1 hypothetical protein [Ruegeria spongiae]
MNHLTKILRAVPKSASAVFGVVLILLQVMAPSLARAGNGDWIEICSDGAAVWIQIDSEGEERDSEPCPKCQNCTLCAISSCAPLISEPVLNMASEPMNVESRHLAQSDVRNPAQFWPDNRGPPRAALNIAERALRASMASDPRTGGAPWS